MPDMNPIGISFYHKSPDADEFYKSMINRGHKINLNLKLVLENCDLLGQKNNSQLKDIFESQKIGHHAFFILLAKHNIKYIYYWLILNSFTPQTYKNLYRYLYITWKEVTDKLYQQYQQGDFDELEDDKLDLIEELICHRFKYTSEAIDEIYNRNQVQNKVLDSLHQFGQKHLVCINFILQHIHNYFS